MEYKQTKQRLVEAQNALNATVDSAEKYAALRQILYGVHIDTDEILHVLDVRAKELTKISSSDFLAVPFDKLPSNTPEETRKKQLLSEFLSDLDRLKQELSKVEAKIESQMHPPKIKKPWHFPNPFKALKKPLFWLLLFITFISGLLQFTSSDVAMLNSGCRDVTFVPVKLPAWLPGLYLPKEALKNGDIAHATIPGLTYTIDGRNPASLRIGVYGLSVIVDISSYDDIQLDGRTLLNRKTDAPSFLVSHELEFICKSRPSTYYGS